MTAMEQAASFLPGRLRTALLTGAKDGEELHLRGGRQFTLSGADGQERPVLWNGNPIFVTEAELKAVVELATCASYHGAAQRLCQGFLPLKGGHRLGVTGSMTVQDGHITGIRQLSSLCLRIAHPVEGIGKEVGRAVFAGGVRSTLLLSPPGMGKTTLLRELIRVGSAEYGLRIGLADERGEVAALWNGVPQMNVGLTTDVVDGCSKAEGLLLLLRSMSPQLLAVDEITAPEDIAALSMAANCGVPILATAHGSSIEELKHRSLYHRLWEEALFRQVVHIRRREGVRRYQVEAMSGA